MTFKIEKGIPIPTKFCNSGIAATMRAMEVGDSVLVPGTANNVSANVAYITRRTSMKFAQRKEGNGYRIWRIK
jgi:hypothetical protein